MNKSRSAAGARLARLGKDVKKTLSIEERKRRGEQGKAALLAYHAKRKSQLNSPTVTGTYPVSDK